MPDDRANLTEALTGAVAKYREEVHEKTLLGAASPSDGVLDPISHAIGASEAFHPVAGKVLYSAESGVILHAESLAAPLLYRAVDDVAAAVNWIVQLLETVTAPGKFKGAIWGLSVDKPVTLPGGDLIVPFEDLPDTYQKRRILERSETIWNGSVWLAENFYDEPRAAFVRTFENFPYIRSDGESFSVIAEAGQHARDVLTFLQARITGHPLAFGWWFDYDDTGLDLSEHEKYLTWILPEVLPVIEGCTSISAVKLQQEFGLLSKLESEWKNDLTRSMERFALSQCRHQTIDRILDLTLAFEILVSGKGSSGPISWKVGVRSAQLIGGPVETRQAIREKINDLYDLRSKGTHGSSLKSVSAEKQDRILCESLPIYRELLGRLIAIPKRPDWNRIEIEPFDRA